MPVDTVERDVMVHFRTSEGAKRKAMEAAEAMGIPFSSLLNAFTIRLGSDGVVPFELKKPDVPNARTRAAMKEAEEQNGESYNSLDAMYAACGIKHRVKKAR